MTNEWSDEEKRTEFKRMVQRAERTVTKTPEQIAILWADNRIKQLLRECDELEAACC